ncbi:MAG: DUF2207 domain-containing protein [Rhodospirillales bacterium]|nr:DUF2207 domain-containing protein [Rhodospirillales bacterium]MCB9996789.1 DUF2207 domain-containing protein [Rhodospirillales bacterium]
MTRWFYTFILSVLFLSAPAQAAEKILSFDSRIAIQPDSSVIVTEIITVTAEQQEIRRGIYRTLPNKYTLPGGRTVQPRLDILEVKRDGKTEPYHIQKSSRETKIYIGQENVFLKPGRYTYTLSYQMGGMVLFEQDYDELAWNVTGTQWAFPIEKATAHVILPNGAPVRSYDAYTGAYGSKDKNFTVRKNIDGSLAFMTTTPLAPRHGITVAVSFPKGYVAEPDMFSASQYDLRPHFMTAAVIGIILFYYILIWLLVGRDLRDEPIIPLFTPPKDISPALCGYIHYMGGISVEKCFAVALVSMATKGAIRIEKEGRKTYKLEKLTGPSAPLSLGEKLLSQKLFTRNARSFTFGKKYSAKAAGAFKTFKKEIIHETGRLYFKKNLLYFVPGVILTLVLMWMIVAKAAFSAYVLILIYIGVLVPDLLLKLVQIPARGFKADMLDIKAILGLLIFIGFFSVMLAEADIVLTIPDMLLGLEFFIIGVITLVFYQLLKAPTIGGRRVMNEIEGFKLFLQTADGEKFRHLDPPEITKELYESYYPYAMALDVEKNWSKKFEAAIISATGEPPGDYHPVWYHGGSFRPGNFSGSMSRGIAAAVTVPSSSSSGGGFSGGGGGGGGGGGW